MGTRKPTCGSPIFIKTAHILLVSGWNLLSVAEKVVKEESITTGDFIYFHLTDDLFAEKNSQVAETPSRKERSAVMATL